MRKKKGKEKENERKRIEEGKKRRRRMNIRVLSSPTYEFSPIFSKVMYASDNFCLPLRPSPTLFLSDTSKWLYAGYPVCQSHPFLLQ